MHGFLNADDYWTKCSARQFLHAITVPTLLLSAKDDPFLTEAAFPFSEAENNPHLTLEVPARGGHLGFLDGQGSWIGRRIPEFLSCEIP
jgi:predicted alpha/beta-fold hydrolase